VSSDGTQITRSDPIENRTKARAFTLLELLLVMVIIVVLAMVIWPNIGSQNSSTRLEVSADQLASLLKLARSGAMSTGSMYRCVFETEGMYAVIETEVDPLQQPGVFEPLQSHWARLDMGKDQIRCLTVEFDEWESRLKAREAELTEGQEQIPGEGISPPIMFYPDGTSDSASIVLGDNDNHSVTLTLNGLTGQISLEKGNKLDENTVQTTD
jgi:prepilin-type N-terminal cleavage/methylation domain-containing protein